MSTNGAVSTIPPQTFFEKLGTEKYVKWVLITPLLLFIIAFMVFPTIYNLVVSFTDYIMRGEADFIGLNNYKEVLHDAEFWGALGRTAYILVCCIVVELLIGMVFALLLNRKFKGENIIRGLCFLPLLVSPLAMSLMWKYMLDVQFGIINHALSWFSLGPVEFLESDTLSIYTIMFISTWQWAPFSIFIFLAGLRGLPKDQFEAARVDGASPVYVFRKLTLPMLKPLIIIIILLRTMWLLRIFDPLYGTTQGGLNTETLDWLVYRISFTLFDIGQGAALAEIALYFTLIVCVIFYKQLIKAMESSSAA